MEKTKVTQLQRDNALYARHVMWPKIQPEAVVPGLVTWRCGTQACFGGFVDASDRPRIQLDPDWPDYRSLLPEEVSKRLFGVSWLFTHRNLFYYTDRNFDGTDHALVAHRLDWLIENSEVINAVS